jgi:hypothetical protein
MISMLKSAQETEKPEIYGGYQFTSCDGGWMVMVGTRARIWTS